MNKKFKKLSIKTISRKLRILLYIILSLVNSAIYAQKVQPEITVSELKSTIYVLASDSLKGRKPGTPEINKAADFIQNQFKTAGLQLAEDNGYQYFDIITGADIGRENKLFFNGFYGKLYQDFLPAIYSKSTFLYTKIVFVGYGISVQNNTLSWDDYKGVDVKGKWVMIFKGHPELNKPDSKFNDYSDERLKVLTATDKGASGVLFVTPSEMDSVDNLNAFENSRNISVAAIPVVYITRSLADLIIKDDKHISVIDLENTINKSMKSQNFNLFEKILIKTDVKIRKKRTANIVGIIEGNNPVLKNEYIVIGAHYDHLGMGGENSGSRMPDTIAVHHGADDNASGVAGLIELAQKLANEKNKLKRSVVFVAFSAEEMGLLGSKYFVKNSFLKPDQIKAMINLDMIGRLNNSDRFILVSGTGTSAEAETILNELSKKTSIKLKYSPDGYGASDHSSFYAENIPVFFLTTGAHEDYHTPMDTPDKINYQGTVQVLDFAYSLILNLINRDKPLTFKEAGSKQPENNRGGLTVTFGIMPDFSSQSDNGVRADLVRKDGPAYKAGMIKGDIITAINGKQVKNIQDYMSRLKQLKKGQSVNVDIIRDGKKLVLIIQL